MEGNTKLSKIVYAHFEKSSEDRIGSDFHLIDPQILSKTIQEAIKVKPEALIHYKTLQQITKQLDRIEKKHDVHDDFTAENHQILLAKLSQLKDENTYFRSELAHKNTPKNLKTYACATIMVCFTDVLVSLLTGVKLFHPAMLSTIFSVSIVFLTMSLIMKKQDNKDV